MNQTVYGGLSALPRTGVTGDVKVMPGTYAGNSYATPLNGNVSVDLRDVCVDGAQGFVFKVTPGCQAVIRLAGEFDPNFVNFTGTLAGIVDASLADGDAPALVILVKPNGTARSIVYAKKQGGVVNAVVIEPCMTVGSGLRHVADVMLTFGGSIVGGLAAPSASPAGLHSLDDNAGTVGKPGTICGAFGTTITGFSAPNGNFLQGDPSLAECRVNLHITRRCTTGDCGDSGCHDSKATHSEASENTVHSIGDRAISQHYGEGVAHGNRITQAAVSAGGGQGKAYQGSGRLVARGDVVDLEPGARLAVANVVAAPGSGPLSTYPRVGALEVHGATDSTGAPVDGPLIASTGQGYTPTVTAGDS